MRLTIIETGLPPAAIRADWPRYPAQFERLLAPHAPELSFTTVSLPCGDPLPTPDGLDSVLITGSPAGVYDPDPWIAELMDFIRASATAGVPMLGICFGHQAIAQAMGGHVAKAPQGWGIGRHAYHFCPPDWMEGAGPTLALNVSHQDQVLTRPPGADVIARSDFTPYAALLYRDAPFLTFQGHPEFDNDFSSALYRVRVGTAFSPERVAEAEASLQGTGDGHRVARWMVAHLRRSRR